MAATQLSLSSFITSLIIMFNHLHEYILYSPLLCLLGIACLKWLVWRNTILCSVQAWSSREELKGRTFCPHTETVATNPDIVGFICFFSIVSPYFPSVCPDKLLIEVENSALRAKVMSHVAAKFLAWVQMENPACTSSPTFYLPSFWIETNMPNTFQ